MKFGELRFSDLDQKIVEVASRPTAVRLGDVLSDRQSVV